MAENLIGKSYMENQRSGEYQFVLTDDTASFAIIVEFRIDEKGKVTYDEPVFE